MSFILPTNNFVWIIIIFWLSYFIWSEFFKLYSTKVNFAIPKFYDCINCPKVSFLIENQTKVRTKCLGMCVCLYMEVWLDEYLYILCDATSSTSNKYLPDLKQNIKIHKPCTKFTSLAQNILSFSYLFIYFNLGYVLR